MTKNFKTLAQIADTQLDAVLEKRHVKKYTLRKHRSQLAYISFDTLKDVMKFLTSKGRF
tara:strand:+ start:273 stop:449 length:177 start_codon:yes stop_codon:yes gene_type:complete